MINLSKIIPQNFARQLAALNFLISFFAILFVATICLTFSYQIVQQLERDLTYKDLANIRDRLEDELNLISREMIFFANSAELTSNFHNPKLREKSFNSLINSAPFEHLSGWRVSIWDQKGNNIFRINSQLPGLRDEDLKIKIQLLENQIIDKVNEPLTAFVTQTNNGPHLLMVSPITFEGPHFSKGFVSIDLHFDDLLSKWAAIDSAPGELVLFANSNPITTPYELMLRLNSSLSGLNLGLSFKPVSSAGELAINQLWPSFLAILFFSLIFSLPLSFFLGKRFAKPILDIANTIRFISLTGRVTSEALRVKLIPSNIEANEIKQLSGDIHHMLERLYFLQNHLESEVQIRNQRIITIFDLSPDGYLELNKHNEIISINKTLLKILDINHFQENELTQEKIKDAINERLIRGQAPFEFERWSDRIIRINAPDLRTISVIKRLTPNHDSIFYWRDLSMYEEMEEMKKAFFAKAAHEIKTPVACIMGFTELLLRDSENNSQQKENLEIILRHTNSLLNQLNTLLNFSKEHQKALVLPRYFQSFSALTASVLKEFKYFDDERALQLNLVDHLPEVSIDSGKYRQVLLNLLSNAHKFSPKGSPIEVSTWQDHFEGRNWVGLSIKDHGIGMNADVMAKIGQRYFRANEKDGPDGTGLGLLIVKEIIEEHNGRVEFFSEPHKGTEVKIWFPV